MTDAEARAILEQARERLGIGLGEHAMDLVQAVTSFETNYGRGWATSCPAAVNAHNWGADQAPCASTPVRCTDHHADGTPYQACIASYPDDVAGAASVMRLLWKRPTTHAVLAENVPDVAAFVHAMRLAGYFEAREDMYRAAVTRHWTRIRASLGRRDDKRKRVAAAVVFVGALIGTGVAVKLIR